MLFLKVIVVVSVVITTAYSQESRTVPTSQDQAEVGRRRAASIANELYGTLRNVAFPSGTNPRTEIENRFLMLMPGKVLNYFDYFPGKEYTKFIQVIT